MELLFLLLAKKGKKLGAFLESYVEMQYLIPDPIGFGCLELLTEDAVRTSDKYGHALKTNDNFPHTHFKGKKQIAF